MSTSSPATSDVVPGGSTAQVAEKRTTRVPIIVAALALPPLVVTTPWVIIGASAPWKVGAAAAEAVFVWLAFRALGRYTRMKLSRALPRFSQRAPSHDVSHTEVDSFAEQVELAEGQLSPEQMILFATSLASPATIRRRVTDRYVPGRRVLQHSVLLEFDLDYTLGQVPHLKIPDQLANETNEETPTPVPPDTAANATPHVETAATASEERPPPDHALPPQFIAVLLPRKGHLHDNSRLVDASGCTVSALSYKEYRILAGLTLRSLLASAFKDAPEIPRKVRALEQEYFRLLLQYGILKEGVTTEARVERVTRELDEATKDLPADRRKYIAQLMEMVKVVATHYAVVGVLPAGTGSRFSLTYESTEVPSLEQRRRTWRSNLQMLLGARPIRLRVSAANAITCQSHHLIVSAPEEMYLADFDIPFNRAPTHGQAPTDSQLSYHRMRGRRGQHYLHLYSRMSSAPTADALHVDTEFHEVPPGSTGRAAISAVAALIICTVVAGVGAGREATVDGDVASFLLAVPGIAAVWLGYESRQASLLEGTLSSRLSLIATFAISLASSIALLVQNSEKHLLETEGRPHPIWLAIIAVAATNAAVTCGLHWQRSRYYQSIEARPAEESSVILTHLPGALTSQAKGS